MTDWPYTLKKQGWTWYWTLRPSKDCGWEWSGASMTKRGALGAMRRIKKREENTRNEQGSL